MRVEKIGRMGRLVAYFGVIFAVAQTLDQAAFATARPAQSISPAGQTVVFAQTLTWIDPQLFAVGRWDGSITIFRLPGVGEYGPVLVQAMSTPSGRGVEMLTAIDPSTIVSSDGDEHLTVWRRPTGGGAYAAVNQVSYDPAIGAANSGVVMNDGGVRYLITGHASGNILIWRDAGASFALSKTIDMRSPNPLDSPYPLRNIRGLAAWRDRLVVTGSEDGDIAAVDIATGQEAFRTRFNPSAQRGINNIALAGNWLLVANCSVGIADKNIWLFDLSSGSPRTSDAENLTIDLGRSQTFNFDVDVSTDGAGGFTFFADTEEGILWQGKIDGDQLVVTGVAKVSTEGGAVAAVGPGNALIAIASGTIRLFKTQ